ncbi:receptor-type tyrosine-protein phosphatase U-like [Saccostrea cucullata]|uniref:receptor-type tyrosine-protein phosphatase U-like n=1 Tax=Saccostrea cuccullata TaxID=36930 RepID=UPI002ED06D41
MLHYTQWSDHDVPEPLSLVIFHRHVMKISNVHPGKYTLVHCSAGIGRTGTYIALDALYKKGEKTGKINVPKYVEAMRNDRMNMIQGIDQYKVVYLALLEAFRGKSRSISKETFLQEFQEHSCYINLGEVANKSPLSAEYQELVFIQKKYTSDDYKSGRTFVSANYSPSVLPVERYTCFLTNTEGKNIYYNAVSIQVFYKPCISIYRHVSFGLPLFLLPVGVHLNATLGIEVGPSNSCPLILGGFSHDPVNAECEEKREEQTSMFYSSLQFKIL